jgi:Rrf2 family transcriptional regulator, nitric oxide-sensitive transcriptional repressor
MQLTRFTDVSLRVLIHLANLEPEKTATTQEIATLYNVSYNHLNKAVHTLSKAGLITSSRGRSGGIQLAKDPTEIGLGEVVRLTEPSAEIIDCFDQPCPLRFSCALKCVLDEAKVAFYAQLAKYTLADVAKGKTIALE